MKESGVRSQPAMAMPSDPMLDAYRPSEQRAILEHKYFLGIDRGCDPSLEDAIESWERHHAMRWRTEKMKRDAQTQIREIENHQRRLGIERGTPVAFDVAAWDWIENHEERWRIGWEQTA